MEIWPNQAYKWPLVERLAQDSLRKIGISEKKCLLQIENGVGLDFSKDDKVWLSQVWLELRRLNYAKKEGYMTRVWLSQSWKWFG